MDFVVNIIPDPLNLCITLVTTLVMFLVLKHFLFNSVKEYLKKRQDYIEASIENAKIQEKNASEKEKLYEGKLSSAKEESQNILNLARNNSEKIISDAKLQAEKEKEKIIANAIKDAENIKENAMQTLKEDIIDIAIGAAKSITKRDLTKEDVSKFTDDRIRELSNKSWEN